MDRRKRNRICIWLIIIGLSNFLLFAVVYALIGGDAQNGGIRENGTFYVRGHHIHRIGGYEREVPQWVWIYSYIHSISIWPSIAAVLLAMLVLARPHIMATYQSTDGRGATRGAVLVTVMATVIIFATSVIMLWFVVAFISELTG